jgi:hypothetical protein
LAEWFPVAKDLMKTMVFLFCFVPAAVVFAADPPTPSNFSVRQAIPLTQAERQREFIESKHTAPVITFGKSDIVLGGPLVAGLRKLPPQENLTLAKKFLRLPVIRLLVPGPMERPPGGTGKYFAWRNDNCDLPWVVAASRPVAARGASVRVEPDSALVQLHR